MKELINKSKELSQVLMQNNVQPDELGLFHGKMGLSIYFFHLTKQSKDIKYNDHAEKLISELYEYIGKSQISTDFQNGLAGIGWGLNHIISQGFVEADIDEVLIELDDKIYKFLISEKEKLPISIDQGIMGYLFYFFCRLKERGSNNIDYNTFILQRVMIDLINILGQTIEEGKYQSRPPTIFNITWDLPIILFLLAKVRSLNIYNTKIDRILEILTPIILSSFPQLNSTRLSLLFGIESVLQVVNLNSWKSHANFIKMNLNISEISENELRNKNVHLIDGLAGINLISTSLYNLTHDERYILDNSVMMKKINASNYWEEIDRETYKNPGGSGLLYGLSGVGMFLLELLGKEMGNSIDSTIT